MTDKYNSPPTTDFPAAVDGYMRLMTLFDNDAVAGSFLNEDGDGGFVGAVYRMAREIERVRSQDLKVTNLDAVGFLESAVRNWSHVPSLSKSDIEDVAKELSRFLLKRVK